MGKKEITFYLILTLLITLFFGSYFVFFISEEPASWIVKFITDVFEGTKEFVLYPFVWMFLAVLIVLGLIFFIAVRLFGKAMPK
jgi:hypothetical protein